MDWFLYDRVPVMKELIATSINRYLMKNEKLLSRGVHDFDIVDRQINRKKEKLIDAFIIINDYTNYVTSFSG